MIKLSTSVTIEIEDGEKIIFSGKVESRRLTKKERRALLKQSLEKIDQSDIVGSHDLMEDISKTRFNMQVSGDGKAGLEEMCEAYGYSVILKEIDTKVEEQQGKR